MRSFIGSVPLFVPGLLVTGTIALLVGKQMAARLACPRWVAFLLVMSLGVIVSATLTPLADALESGTRSTGVCDVDRTGWAPLRTYLRVDEESMNVLMFVPLGIAIAFIPGTPGRWLAVAALILPFAIELLQLLFPALGRECEAADMVDNPTGLVIGLAIGWFGRSAIRAIRAQGWHRTG